MRNDIVIIDNRKCQFSLDVYEDGYGRWYCYHTETGGVIATKTKAEAIEVKRYADDYDWGE